MDAFEVGAVDGMEKVAVSDEVRRRVYERRARQAAELGDQADVGKVMKLDRALARHKSHQRALAGGKIRGFGHMTTGLKRGLIGGGAALGAAGLGYGLYRAGQNSQR